MFYGCTSLISVTIPSTVKTIGDWVFGGCKALESVAMPSSVTTLGDGALGGCEILSAITMATSIKTLGIGVFYGCERACQIMIDSSFKHLTKELSLVPVLIRGFKGKPQNGYGPEWCGISFERLQKMKEHPHYKRRARWWIYLPNEGIRAIHCHTHDWWYRSWICPPHKQRKSPIS